MVWFEQGKQGQKLRIVWAGFYGGWKLQALAYRSKYKSLPRVELSCVIKIDTLHGRKCVKNKLGHIISSS